MKGWFWWPGMATALCLAIQNCGRCKQFEAKSQLPGMEPILCTQPMELVHVDYVGMEVTVAAKEKRVVKNVLVVVDHFTCYVQDFVTKTTRPAPQPEPCITTSFLSSVFPRSCCWIRELSLPET